MEVFSATGSHVKAGNTTTLDPLFCNGVKRHTRNPRIREEKRRNLENSE
jgi:hypothetical protein